MIAVISDSHIPTRAEKIPEPFLEKMDEADIVVHCGDFDYPEVKEKLEERYGEIVAVQGNCDRIELPKYQKFEHGDVKFGVTHGTGITPRGDHDTLANIADQMKTRILFHGHTHQQEAVEHNGKILLNPGSCTGVGGGSANEGVPKMMTVEVKGTELKVVLLKKERPGKFARDERIFPVKK
jgi:hypothetical protein